MEYHPVVVFLPLKQQCVLKECQTNCGVKDWGDHTHCLKPGLSMPGMLGHMDVKGMYQRSHVLFVYLHICRTYRRGGFHLQMLISLSLIAYGGSQSQYVGQWPIYSAGSFPHNQSTCVWPMHKSVLIKIIRMGWAERRAGGMKGTNAREISGSIQQ